MFSAPKYAGTPVFHAVRQLLVDAARRHVTVTYGDVAALMGLPPRGNQMGKETGHLLGELSAQEHAAGGPMISAVVVNSAGRPGKGFFGLAKDLGKTFEDESDSKMAFWRSERDAVYAYPWQ